MSKGDPVQTAHSLTYVPVDKELEAEHARRLLGPIFDEYFPLLEQYDERTGVGIDRMWEVTVKLSDKRTAWALGSTHDDAVERVYRTLRRMNDTGP